MSRLVASSLAGVLLAGLAPLAAQAPDADPPARHVPARPATRQELDHLEALKLFARGAVLERQSRLVEAMHTLEAARRLDPEAAAVERALIPLYLALERLDDALAACKRVLELDPDDFETGYRYARQLRLVGDAREARAVLARVAACPGLKDHLDVRAQVFYDLGQLQEAAGDLDGARKSLREVLAILDDPQALMDQGPYNRDEVAAQAAETCERLGRLCLKAGRPDEAVAAFEKALKKDPVRSARLALNLAEVHAAAGRPDKALAQVEQYLRTQPQGTEGYELRIRLQRQSGRGGEVVPALERSASADRHNEALHLLLAREYGKAGRADDAEKIYRDLLERSPTPDVYRGLFGLYRSMGQSGADRLLSQLDAALGTAANEGGKDGKADEARRDAARQAAGHARAMLAVLRDDAELVRLLLPAATRRLTGRGGLKYTTCLMLAGLAGRTRQLDAAEALYRHCLRQGRPPGLPNNEAELYIGLLTVLSLAHKNEAIIDLCNAGLQQAENTNRLLFLGELASAHMALGHVNESLRAADEAVKVAGNPDSRLTCRLQRAQLLSQAERHEQAVAECRQLLREYNQTGDVHRIRLVLSSLYSSARDADRAEEQLLLVLKDDPDDATANNDLGYLWADRGKKLAEAERRVRRALELEARQRKSLLSTRVGLEGDQDNAAFVDSLGWVLFRKGDWQGARRELERAASLPHGDDDPVVWDHLGDVCFRQGDAARAAEAWNKAVRLYESGGRRRPDERYRDIKDKLRTLTP